MPAGRDHPQAARDVGDVAVLVGLHPRRAGRDPAAERRVGEAVGEVPERPAPGVELLLEVRGRARRPAPAPGARRRRSSSTRSRRPRSTETIGGRSSSGRLEAAGDVGAAAEGDDDGVGVQRRRAGSRRPRPRRRAQTTTSGRRPRSPRRTRTRSRRLLPHAWTTRSSASVETCAAPTARLERGQQAVGRATARGRRGRRRPPAGSRAGEVDAEVARTKGARPACPRGVNAMCSSPQPHHFIPRIRILRVVDPAGGVHRPTCNPAPDHTQPVPRTGGRGLRSPRSSAPGERSDGRGMGAGVHRGVHRPVVGPTADADHRAAPDDAADGRRGLRALPRRVPAGGAQGRLELHRGHRHGRRLPGGGRDARRHARRGAVRTRGDRVPALPRRPAAHLDAGWPSRTTT